MLIAIDTSPCVVLLRNRSMFRSNMAFLCTKVCFFISFFSFCPNLMRINGGYFPAVCRVCFLCYRFLSGNQNFMTFRPENWVKLTDNKSPSNFSRAFTRPLSIGLTGTVVATNEWCEGRLLV